MPWDAEAIERFFVWNPTLIPNQFDRIYPEDLDVIISGVNAGDNLPELASSDQFEVEVRLSTDRIWGNDDDVILGVLEEIENIGGNQRFIYAQLFNLDFCIPEGSYYLGAQVDSAKRYAEFDETNNVTFSDAPSIRIEHAPMLLITNRTYRPGIYYRGQNLEVEWDVFNIGCVGLLPGQEAIYNVQMRGGLQDVDFDNDVGLRIFNTPLNFTFRDLGTIRDDRGIPAESLIHYEASFQIPRYNEEEAFESVVDPKRPP